MERWRVELPRGIEPPFEVYVNGVRQTEGADYAVDGRLLVFTRPLAQEGRLGFWRWFWGAWGIGTYRAHHTIDVRYQRAGQTLVAHALRPLPPSGDAASGDAPSS